MWGLWNIITWGMCFINFSVKILISSFCRLSIKMRHISKMRRSVRKLFQEPTVAQDVAFALGRGTAMNVFCLS